MFPSLSAVNCSTNADIKPRASKIKLICTSSRISSSNFINPPHAKNLRVADAKPTASDMHMKQKLQKHKKKNHIKNTTKNRNKIKEKSTAQISIPKRISSKIKLQSGFQKSGRFDYVNEFSVGPQPLRAPHFAINNYVCVCVFCV